MATISWAKDRSSEGVWGMPRRWRKALGAAVICGGLGLATSVSAQSELFAGELDAAQQAEVEQWMAMYATLVDRGLYEEGAFDFAYTTAIMNTPLFSPRHAVARTVTSATALPIDACFVVVGTVTDAQLVEEQGQLVGGEEVVAVVDYLNAELLSTDLSTDPQAGIQHLTTLAQSGTPVEMFISGTVLMSLGLPVALVEGSAIPGATVTVSAETQGVIDQLIMIAPTSAGLYDYSHEATAELTGQPTTVSQFINDIELQVESLVGPNVSWSVHQADAVFGAYGRLPMAVVRFDDGVILVDALTGAIAGPYDPDDALSGLELLLLHPEAYSDDMSQGVVDAAECYMKKWRGTPPPGGPFLPLDKKPAPPTGTWPTYPYTPPGPIDVPYPQPGPVEQNPNFPGHYTVFSNGLLLRELWNGGLDPATCSSKGLSGASSVFDRWPTAADLWRGSGESAEYPAKCAGDSDAPWTEHLEPVYDRVLLLSCAS